MLENELHDDWINQKNFSAFYRKPSSVTPELKSMETQIINKIKKLCGVDASSGTKGPKGIANELSLVGGIGDGGTDCGEKIYKVYAEGYDDGEKIENLLPDGTLNLRYKIKKKSEILSDTKVKLDYTLRSDSGETIKIPFDNINISHNKKPIEWEIVNNQIRFLMAENVLKSIFSYRKSKNIQR